MFESVERIGVATGVMCQRSALKLLVMVWEKMVLWFEITQNIWMAIWWAAAVLLIGPSPLHVSKWTKLKTQSTHPT